MKNIYDNIDVAKSALTKQIEKYVPEYMEFIGTNSFPEYKVEVIPKNNNPKHAIAYVDCNNNGNILYIGQYLLDEYNNTNKSIIFHELNHIYNQNNLFQDVEFEKRKKLINAYDEYNSTIVQMKVALNFQHKNDEKSLSFSDKVYDGKEIKTIIEYIKSTTKNSINTCNDRLQTNHIPSAILHTIYYFAKIDFFETYCSESISDFIDYKFFYDTFGINTSIFHNMLKSAKCNDIDDIEFISKLQEGLGKEYLLKRLYH